MNNIIIKSEKYKGGNRLDKKKKQEPISIEEYLKRRQKIRKEESDKKKKDQESASTVRFSGSALFFSGVIGSFFL